jgi:predicted permease
VDAGFDPSNKVTFGVVLPQASYPDSVRRMNFIVDMTRNLERIPGVQKAAAMQGLPPFRQVNANDTNFEGLDLSKPGSPPANVDYYQAATVGYFEAMGIKIVEGRSFDATDANGPPVMIVNQTLAKRYYPGQSAIGRRIQPGFGQDTPYFTIIGVAKDVKQGGLDANVGTELYALYEQMPLRLGFVPGQMNIVINSTRPLAALAPSIRKIVHDMDPALPIIQLRTMEDVIGASVTRQRFLSLLLGIFAVVALTLAAIGTYGILSYMVSERQREIGIRMALGAGNNQVVGLVLGQGMTIALAGIVVGVVGAYGLSRLTASLLFGVSPSDPATYSAVAVVIAAVAVAACIVPIRKATRVDPLEAIRAD